MSYPVRLTALAEKDIAEAFDYYEGKKENLGFEFLGEVDESIQSISQHPLSHRKIIGDVRRRNIKRFLMGSGIGWKPTAQSVIACLHHKRSPELAAARARKALREPRR